MMKTVLLASLPIFALAAPRPVPAAMPAAPADPVIHLGPEAIVVISPEKEVPRARFDAQSGEISILVHKDRFPLAAPNCHHDVLARVPEVELGKTVGPEELARRWTFLQKLRTAWENRKPIELTLISQPYLKVGKDGSPELPYCSAFFRVR